MPDPGVNSVTPYNDNLQAWLLFSDSKKIALLLSYTCKSFIELTLGSWGWKCYHIFYRNDWNLYLFSDHKGWLVPI